MYIRLKRKNQTVFLHVEPSNSFGQVKQRVAEIVGVADPSKIMLVANDKVKSIRHHDLLSLIKMFRKKN
jgi:hypothetical protein